MQMPKSFVQSFFPWGKYKFKRLPMGIKIAPDVFQNVMSKLTQDLEYVKTYLDDLLFLTNCSFADHLTKLEMVLARLSTAGMRVNASKSKFFAEQNVYLGLLDYLKWYPTSIQ
jgi:Reverse transcriptase (RNA-dependent DNA polymerase)